MITYSKETTGEQVYLVLTSSDGSIKKIPYDNEVVLDVDLNIIKTKLENQVSNKNLEIASINIILT